MSASPGPAGATDSGTVFTVAGGRPLQGRVRVPGDKSISHRALLLGALADGDVGAAGTVRRRRRGAHRRGRRRPRGARRWPRRGARLGDRPLRERRDLRGQRRAARAGGGARHGQLGHHHPAAGRGRGRAALHHAAHRGRVTVEPAHGPGGRAPAADGGHGRGSRGALPPPAHDQRRRPAWHRLHHAHGERPGEVVRAPGRLGRRRRDGGARAGADPAPHRGDAGALRGGRHRARRATTARTWCDSGARAWRRSSSTCPGDPSQAAFWVVAACVVPGSAITVERVYVGRGRRGYLDVLARMGAAIDEVPATGPGDLAATADLRGAVRTAAGHRGRRRRRSPASTRSPCWPWRPPARRATPCSGTWGSCG